MRIPIPTKFVIILTYTRITPEIAAKITPPRWPTEFNRQSTQALADDALEDGLITKKADVAALLPWTLEMTADTTIAPAIPGARRKTDAPPWLLGLGGLVGFALLLEIVPRIRLVSPHYLPPFSEIVVALARGTGDREFLACVRRHHARVGVGTGDGSRGWRGDRHRHRQFEPAADADLFDPSSS